MKSCAYCGRENRDEATHCRECGTSEFVKQAQQSRPAEKSVGLLFPRKTKVMLLCGTAAILLLMVCVSFGFRGSPGQSITPIGISLVGFPSPSAISISLVVTNPTPRTIVYIVCPPQVKSNGVWTEVQLQVRPTPMAVLPPTQTATLDVAQPTQGHLCRVPLVWGYQPRPRPWELARNFILGNLTGRYPGVNGALYTNFSPEIRL